MNNCVDALPTYWTTLILAKKRADFGIGHFLS